MDVNSVNKLTPMGNKDEMAARPIGGEPAFKPE
jgi:hypothetical protein